MQVIHVVLGKANPARMNGVNKVVHELATQQKRAGITVSLWGISRSLVHDYPARTYPTHLFRATRNWLSVNGSIVHAVDQLPPDAVLHLHGGFIPLFFHLARLLHRRNIPFVFTPHGSYNTLARQKNYRIKYCYFLLFERTLLRYAQCIHCLGKSEVSGLHQWYPAANTVLIPYGYEAINITTVPDKGRFVLGFCGRIDVYTKGLDALLKAFSLFTREAANTELWIIGDSSQRAGLQKYAQQLSIDKKVIFFGSLFGEDKLSLLQQMHVFVHPSRNEGLPAAVLEAASLGIPCLVTEATNVGDQIRAYDCGEVIPATDSLLLYRAMIILYQRIQAGQRAVMSQQAQRMIKECFNWEKTILALQQIYDRA